MVGSSGIAADIKKETVTGSRVTFLPRCRMMNLNHTGLVNMALQESYGLQIRAEDIKILAWVQISFFWDVWQILI